MAAVLTGCASSSTQTPDDYATNEGYTSTEETGSATTSGEANVSKNDIKVGVLYISDPSEGSGYSYTRPWYPGNAGESRLEFRPD